jgi:hypothetical protein
MQRMPGRPRRRTRLAAALGLDGNPLRRASDRAEAWIRIALLAVFLITSPIAALGAGGWAYHTEATAARVGAAPAHHVTAAVPATTVTPAGLPKFGEGDWPAARSEGYVASARSDEVLAEVMTLAFMALALQTALWLTRAFLTRRRLVAWEKAWSRVGPQWTGRTS